MRLIALFMFVLVALFSSSALARFSPDDEATIEYHGKRTGKPLSKITKVFAQVTPAEFAMYSSLIGPTDNPRNIVTLNFTTNNSVIPRVHLMHDTGPAWMRAKNAIARYSYIVVTANVSQSGGSSQEQHALRQIAGRIAFYWAGPSRANYTLSNVKTRDGMIPLRSDEPLGESREVREVFDISVMIEFVVNKMPFPLFTHERMLKVITDHYRPEMITVSLWDMPINVLRAYPFLVRDLFIPAEP